MVIMDFWRVIIEPYFQKLFWNEFYLMNMFLNIYLGFHWWGLYKFSFGDFQMAYIMVDDIEIFWYKFQFRFKRSYG